MLEKAIIKNSSLITDIFAQVSRKCSQRDLRCQSYNSTTLFLRLFLEKDILRRIAVRVYGQYGRELITNISHI